MNTIYEPPVPCGYEEILLVFGAVAVVPLAINLLPHPIGPITRARTHLRLIDTDNRIWAEIDKKGLWDHLHDFGGCFAERTIRGDTKHLSTHAWAIAKDINVAANPLGSVPPDTYDAARPFVFTADHPVVRIFETNGYYWGGRFLHRKDPMHFQYATRY